MADRIHVYPVTKRNKSDHRTDSSEMCWCGPLIRQVCPESPSKGDCAADCWRCEGTGWVEPYDDTLSIAILHKEGQFFDESI
jgi:hypothetical protein